MASGSDSVCGSIASTMRAERSSALMTPVASVAMNASRDVKALQLPGENSTDTDTDTSQTGASQTEPTKTGKREHS